MPSLFSEDTEADGSPTRSPTLTFYGSRQAIPLQRILNPDPPITPRSAPLAPSTPRNEVPQPVIPRSTTSSPPHSARIPAVSARIPAVTVRKSVPSSIPGRARSQDPQLQAISNSTTILDKFPITAAWLSGVLVGVIAHSLARGDSWRTAPLREALGPLVIWLRPGVPQEAQVAAWLVKSDNSSSQP